MSSTNAQAVRQWLMKGPGLVVGVTSQDCLKKAWGLAGGLDMSLGAFIDCLHAENQRPDVIRPGVYHLNMPDKPNE